MEADDPYAGESAMARTAAHEARAKVALAQREQRPDLLDEAAGLWEDIAANSLREVAIRDARFQSARTRHAAWRLQPSAARRTAGRDAAQLYLQVAPARGEERESALRWLREFAAAIR